jgi:arylsulfatase A-like enzyme
MKARLGWTARLASTLGMLALAPAAAPPSQRPPNFVFIQGEAQGPSSISVDMDGDPASPSRPSGLTPNLEKLASNGMRFSDFYASCPRCTPSRASFVTGISPAKLHMTYQNEGGASRREGGAKGGGKANDGGEGVEDASKYRLMRMIPPQIEPDLPPGVKTSGARLGELGYGTAHFGKWHAGRAEPSKVGFDRCDCANSNQSPERGVAPNPKQATVITDKGIAFMREQVKAGKPFFVQISHYGFGSEEEATPEALAVAKRLVPGVSGKPLGAIAGAHDVDTQVGRVVAALKEMGVADNTYIFYSADHGAQGGGGGGRSQANPPFSGGKGSVREGGIRVPLIAAGPGIQAGTVSHVRATGMDLLPTMLDLSGHPVPKHANPDARTEIEGGSLAPVLKGDGTGEVKRSHEEIVIHFLYADNWFMLYVNGKPVAVDSIDFLRHNVVAVDLLPEYPMTIAVLAKDNADPKTGCEYGRQIGDGGFILKFGDGTVTDASWKARCFFHGPVNRDTANPTVRTEPLPADWFAPGFDDASWANATEYSQERIDPKQPFFEHDFKGAKWIWTSDLDLDNTVVLRKRVERPGVKPRWTTKPDLDVSNAPRS